ncbi:hypothetical protein [Citreimonas salinaria]|uniref:NADH-quinone oxidoreductase subunit E n=1 Tax=Citreimonas salinaria TaxID=321339 RepID=A0A1H3GWV7_9RHOB|nr:hypothetical protein [Citreimonas salinaria]SDY07550.1 NADH-quinone oxidoreductase subunit E [Citreimonas salinaria]
MTKTTPMMPPVYDFGAMVDFWHQQSNAMLTFNLQMMRAAMAPWEAMGLSPRSFVNLGMMPAAVAATEAAMAPAGEPSSAEPMPADADVGADKADAEARADDTAAQPARVAGELARVGTPVEPGNAEAAEAAVISRKPSGLKTPRAAGADDLRRITGLGPKLQESLNEIGIYHFDQIADWTPGEIAWIDENVGGVRGRASRDDWAKQAAALARGDKG